MVKLSWVLKVNFLILTLGLVFYTILQINRKGLPGTVWNVLGVSPPHHQANSIPRKLTWCETRVRSMENSKGFRIYQDDQEKFKWFSSTQASPPQEIELLAIEKWFGKHCSLQIESVNQEVIDQGGFKTALVIEFIKGTAERLLKNDPNIYSWKGQVFRSPQLDIALSELESFEKKDFKE